jgi:putative SOS response-associated peptidase YedK
MKQRAATAAATAWPAPRNAISRALWLTCQLKALLAPYPSKAMTCWPVSRRVGNIKNNDPSLIEPVAAA